jgi:acyl-CoA thioester hydrolase
VRYAETDKMGVVYYANYLVWFEVGRTEWLRACGPTYRGLESEGIGLPVIEAGCQYHVPGRYDDEVDVRTDGRLLSPARVRFDYEVVRVTDAVVLARGHTVHAVMNNRTGRPCRLPAEIRTLFE